MSYFFYSQQWLYYRSTIDRKWTINTLMIVDFWFLDEFILGGLDRQLIVKERSRDHWNRTCISMYTSYGYHDEPKVYTRVYTVYDCRSLAAYRLYTVPTYTAKTNL